MVTLMAASRFSIAVLSCAALAEPSRRAEVHRWRDTAPTLHPAGPSNLSQSDESLPDGQSDPGPSLCPARFSSRAALHRSGRARPGLGIGATSAIFSVVRGVMLKPLPLSAIPIASSRSGRTTCAATGRATSSARRTSSAWRERNRSFDAPRHGRARAAERCAQRPAGRGRRPCRPRPTCSPRSASSPRSGAPYTPDRGRSRGQRRRHPVSATSSGSRGSAAAPTCSARRSPPTAGRAPSSASCRRDSRSKGSAPTS